MSGTSQAPVTDQHPVSGATGALQSGLSGAVFVVALQGTRS
jgi:hypothetical protein